MKLRLALLAFAAFGMPAYAQTAQTLTCSGVDALGRTVERPCAATAPDPLRTTGVYTEEERLDTDADRNAARLRQLERLAKPLPKQPDDIRGKPQIGIGFGPYGIDTTEETRKRIERERTDPYAVDTVVDD